ncbi:MAG: S8 family serine peptidase, partial [Acidobacteria bacterium]|nr:S8 family serine peptidase [Acidobacteriota bacterium]NIQ85358.1 S8 family serine peptidase [Acidobacteriota bacterium]
MSKQMNRSGWPEWVATATLLAAVIALTGWSNAETQHIMMVEEEGGGGGGKVSQTVNQTAQENPTQPLPVIVSYNAPPTQQQIEELQAAGGEVSALLNGSNALSAVMTAEQAAALGSNDSVVAVGIDAPMVALMDVSRRTIGHTHLPRPLDGLTGAGVTIALLDSGIASHSDLVNKVIARVDVIDQLTRARDSNEVLDTGSEQFFESGAIPDSPLRQFEGESVPMMTDPFGHGTHIAGILASSGQDSRGVYKGVAPGARLVDVRVLDENGGGSVSGVVAGIDWVIQNKDVYGIRVLSMSLGHAPLEPTDMDPLVLAVERAWRAGIVVFVSAGNFGAYGNWTITSPGNSQQVVTVGSLTDWNTFKTTDDMVSSYSSRGPALSGTLKPDFVAPGNRIVSTRAAGSYLDTTYPEWRVTHGPADQAQYFELSGTSMATPVAAASAALMLEADPALTPDNIKARMMLSADASLAGHPLDHGAGSFDLEAALKHTSRVASAPSPMLVRNENVEGEIRLEDVAQLWNYPPLYESTIWGD